MSDIQDRADELGDKLLALSVATSEDASVLLRTRVGEFKAALVALWVKTYGSIDYVPVDLDDAARFADAALPLLMRSVTGELTDAGVARAGWSRAYALGVAHALAGLSRRPESLPEHPDPQPPALARVAMEQAARAASALAAVAVVGQGFASVGNAIAALERAVTRVEANVAYSLTKAANQAVADLAEQTGLGRIWVAERDGCLHCLAYAGVVTDGATFPADLTFTEKPLRPLAPFDGPALHPFCRCSTELHDPADTAIADGLQREAKRSVLKGFSLDTESESARLDAAERLLARGSGLPKSVEATARAAVRRGGFTDRVVPGA